MIFDHIQEALDTLQAKIDIAADRYIALLAENAALKKEVEELKSLSGT